MRNLPKDRKKYLLRQNRMMKTSFTNNRLPDAVAQSSTVGPARASQILPAITPSLTGDNGLMKRFSITSWAGTSTGQISGSPTAPSSPLASQMKVQMKLDNSREAIEPLQPQSTGSLWSSWWLSSGGESSKSLTRTKSSDPNSASTYVDNIRSRRTTDVKLVKHLISLRVHLSTAKLSWVEDFLGENAGMDVLGTLLGGLVGKGGKRKKHTETEETVLYEVIKCLRVLLNTEVS